jgi:hypothetical protein
VLAEESGPQNELRVSTTDSTGLFDIQAAGVRYHYAWVTREDISAVGFAKSAGNQ